MQKEKIGFFGGSFNPPTNVHINLAKDLIKDKIVEKVVFVPVGDYYSKQDLIPAKHRYNMLKIACEENKNLLVEDIAVNYEEKLYTSDTLKLLQEKYKEKCDIYFIMGSDNFNKMPNWKDYKNMIEKYKFIVMDRFETEVNANMDLDNVIYYKTNQTEDISSTCIREKIHKGEEVSEYINPKVLKYIEENKLY